MRRAFVAANWKMHGRASALDAYAAGAVRAAPGGAEIVLCPPAPYSSALGDRLAGAVPDISLGAQDCSVESDDGPYTGEISAAMLADVGCSWVIVGHSERRHRYGESDATVAAKFAAVRAAGLNPILCVGETSSEREAGRADDVVLGQLEAVIERVGMEQLSPAVIAYEPVWAIGSGKPATPAEAARMHGLLRRAVARRDPAAADTLRIVYGGSVKHENSARYFAEADIDGALVGGASLDVEEFMKIAAAAAESKARAGSSAAAGG